MRKLLKIIIISSRLVLQILAYPQNFIPPEESNSKYLDFNKIQNLAQKSGGNSNLNLVKPIEEIHHDNVIKNLHPDHVEHLSKILDLKTMISHMYENVKSSVSKTEVEVGNSVHHIVDALHHMSHKLFILMFVFIFTLMAALMVFIYIRKYESIGGPRFLTRFCHEQNLIDKDHA